MLVIGLFRVHFFLSNNILLINYIVTVHFSVIGFMLYRIIITTCTLKTNYFTSKQYCIVEPAI